MAESIADAVVNLKVDTSGIQRKFREVRKSSANTVKGIDALKQGLVALGGAAILRSFGKLVFSSIQLGSKITDMAAQMRITTTEFQALEFAALKAGVPPQKLLAIITKLAQTMGDAERGMKTYSDLFDTLGIDIKGKGTLKVFEEVAIAISNAASGTKEFSAALGVLGTRAGAQFLEVFQRFNEVGLEGIIKDAKEAGIVISEEIAGRADAAADSWVILGRKIGKVVNDLAFGTVDVVKFWKAFFVPEATFELEGFLRKTKEARLEREKAARSSGVQLRKERRTGERRAFETATRPRLGAEQRKQLDELNKLEEDNANKKLRNLFDEMTLVGQITELKKREAEREKKEFANTAGSLIERAKNEGKILDLQDRRNSLEERRSARLEAISGTKAELQEQLQEERERKPERFLSGVFVGAADTVKLAQQIENQGKRREEERQERRNELLQEIAENTKAKEEAEGKDETV